MSTARPKYTPKPHAYELTGVEADLLDQIEKSAKRSYQMATAMRDETDLHIKLLSQAEEQTDSANEALLDGTLRAQQVVEGRADGYGWMYSVICIESVVLLLLIIQGLV